MQLLQNGKQQFIDQNGLPLANGTVGFYAVGTLNPLPTYQDQAGTIQNANPITLDSRGQAIIWGTGTYRQIVKDASGVTIWDQIVKDSNAALTGNITDDNFVSGTDFTPGVTTALTLSSSPGVVQNVWMFFDGFFQARSNISSVNGTTLTLAAPIPVGVQTVTVKSGTTIALGTPASGSVSDTQVGANSKLYNRINDIVDARDAPYNAKCDGTTDDGAAINTAISTLSALGGGTLLIPATFATSVKIIFRRNVNITFMGGAKIKWIGSASGTIAETLSSDVVQNCTWSGLTIDTGAAFAGVALNIHSAYNINADVIRFISTGTTSTCLLLSADSSGGESSLTKRNLFGCTFGSIVQEGDCGTLLKTNGVQVGYDGGPQVVTLNTFGTIFGNNQWVNTINLYNWTDNNAFNGFIRGGIAGNNAIGIVFNGQSLTTDVGVYANTLMAVGIDAFGVYTGRVGVKFNAGKENRILTYYQYPQAEGGPFAADNTCLSYEVNYVYDGDATIRRYKRQVFDLIGGNSPYFSLADGAAISFPMQERGINANISFLLMLETDNDLAYGTARLRIRTAGSGGSPSSQLVAGGSAINMTTGVLTGTTGPTSKVSISAGSDGNMYIENRMGLTLNFTLEVHCLQQTA